MGYKHKLRYGGNVYASGVGKIFKKAWRNFKKGLEATRPYVKPVLKFTEEITRPVVDSLIDHTIIDKEQNQFVKDIRDNTVKKHLNKDRSAPSGKDIGKKGSDMFSSFMHRKSDDLFDKTFMGSGLNPTGSTGRGKYTFPTTGLVGDDMLTKKWRKNSTAWRNESTRQSSLTGKGFAKDYIKKAGIPLKFRKQLGLN